MEIFLIFAGVKEIIMEKTMEQVARHLALRAYSDDDWEAIREMFKRRFGKLPRRAMRPKGEETLQDFEVWMREGLADGDVVRMGEYVGILSDRVSSRYLSAFRLGKGHIVVAEKIVLDPLEPVDDDVAESFVSQLREFGYSFRVSMSAVVPITLVPAFTRVSYDGKCGIIGGYVNSTVRMLVEVDGDRLNLDAEYPVFSIDFKNASPREIRLIDRVLLANGLRYDAASRELMKAVSRVGNGEKFWYINENFGVSAAIEKHTKTQDLRYRNGNYFLSLSSAMDFQKRLAELVKGYEKGTGD